MKISTRGRYGLKAIVDIAYETSKGCDVISLKSIAARQGISENYLEQIVAQIKKAGYLTSVRGAGGGYVLSKDPEDITAGEILRALEGSLSPADCLEDENASCGTASCDNCVVKGVLSKIFDGLNDIVDSITIKDIITGISADNR